MKISDFDLLCIGSGVGTFFYWVWQISVVNRMAVLRVENIAKAERGRGKSQVGRFIWRTWKQYTVVFPSLIWPLLLFV